MPLLKPIVDNSGTNLVSFDKLVSNIERAIPELRTPKDDAKAFLNEAGADLRTACHKMSNFMNCSDDEGIAFKATEIILEMHEAHRSKESGGGGNITFNIQGSDVNLNQLLLPNREQ